MAAANDVLIILAIIGALTVLGWIYEMLIKDQRK